MRQLSETELTTEYNRFKDNAIKAGLGILFEKPESEQTFKNAVCGLTNDSGCAYPGSLLVHVNYVIALSIRMANMLSATFQISEDSIIRSCIIQHIAKTIMFEPNDNEWEVSKRGVINKFTKLDGRLKCGARGMYIASLLNIRLTPIEAEAVLSIDRSEDNAYVFDDIMTTIIRQANELAYAIEKKKYGEM